MRVLIPTILYDTHSTAVGMGLEAKGHEAILWHGADFPKRQQGSINISEDGSHSWRLSGSALDLEGEGTDFDVVWYRRVSEPVLPENLHSGDRLIAQRTCEAFSRALWKLIAPNAFWVNPLATRGMADLKPVQLIEAKRVGLTIPPTLCSNEPAMIREFLKAHENNTIYKPYLPAVWKRGEDQFLLLTSSISTDDLPGDEVLRLSSGIFQKRIEKAYELRVTYMGDFYIATKILSQENDSTRLDWRADYGALEIEPFKLLPTALDKACKRLMERLGIVFGCFDFIVTPDGDYVFLEVNEMGQFLWIEEMNPEILMLDPFCEFLMARKVDFEWHPRRDSLKFGDFLDKALKQQEGVDSKIHEQRPFRHLVEDIECERH